MLQAESASGGSEEALFCVRPGGDGPIPVCRPTTDRRCVSPADRTESWAVGGVPAAEYVEGLHKEITMLPILFPIFLRLIFGF